MAIFYSGDRRVRAIVAAATIASAVLVVACDKRPEPVEGTGEQEAPSEQAGPESPTSEQEREEGEATQHVEVTTVTRSSDWSVLGEQHCTRCHTRPAVFDHSSSDWPYVFGLMSYWLGMTDEDLVRVAERVPQMESETLISRRDGLVALGEISETATMTYEQWEEVLQSYVDGSPDSLRTARAPSNGRVVEGWNVREPGGGEIQGMAVTSLTIDAANRRLIGTEMQFGASGQTGSVFEWTDAGGLGRRARLESTPTAAELLGSDIYVTLIGDMFPSDEAVAGVVRLADSSSDWPVEPVLSQMLRSPHALPIEGEGGIRFLVSSYGHQRGRLWIAAPGDDGVTGGQTLVNEPGASESVRADIDGDGQDEFLVLYGQAFDGVWVVRRETSGAWSSEPLIRQSPAWGHSDLNVADMDGDGDIDLIVANGDNLDIPGSPPRPYHGVRVYSNDGSGAFTESSFVQFDGAYGVAPGNFDEDPELEIAVVNYFIPEDSSAPSVAILDRNVRGGWDTLIPAGIPESGKFCRVAAGDLAGDARDEIVLGGCYRQPPGPDAPRLVVLSAER